MVRKKCAYYYELAHILGDRTIGVNYIQEPIAQQSTMVSQGKKKRKTMSNASAIDGTDAIGSKGNNTPSDELSLEEILDKENLDMARERLNLEKKRLKLDLGNGYLKMAAMIKESDNDKYLDYLSHAERIFGSISDSI